MAVFLTQILYLSRRHSFGEEPGPQHGGLQRSVVAICLLPVLHQLHPESDVLRHVQRTVPSHLHSHSHLWPLPGRQTSAPVCQRCGDQRPCSCPWPRAGSGHGHYVSLRDECIAGPTTAPTATAAFPLKPVGSEGKSCERFCAGLRFGSVLVVKDPAIARYQTLSGLVQRTSLSFSLHQHTHMSL